MGEAFKRPGRKETAIVSDELLHAFCQILTFFDPFLIESDHLFPPKKCEMVQPRRLGNAIVETQEGARAELKKRERATRQGPRSCIITWMA